MSRIDGLGPSMGLPSKPGGALAPGFFYAVRILVSLLCTEKCKKIKNFLSCNINNLTNHT